MREWSTTVFRLDWATYYWYCTFVVQFDTLGAEADGFYKSVTAVRTKYGSCSEVLVYHKF